MNALGDAFRVIRTLRHQNQRLAAIHLDISNVYLCEIEKGKATPSLDVIDRARKAWGIDPCVLAWVLGGDVEQLPVALRKSAQALKDAWRKQLKQEIRQSLGL